MIPDAIIESIQRGDPPQTEWFPYYLALYLDSMLADALINGLTNGELRDQWREFLKSEDAKISATLRQIKLAIMERKARLQAASLEEKRAFPAWEFEQESLRATFVAQRDKVQFALALTRDTNRELAETYSAFTRLYDYLMMLLRELESAPAAERDAAWENELRTLLGQVQHVYEQTPQTSQFTAPPRRRGKKL